MASGERLVVQTAHVGTVLFKLRTVDCRGGVREALWRKINTLVCTLHIQKHTYRIRVERLTTGSDITTLLTLLQCLRLHGFAFERRIIKKLQSDGRGQAVR